MPVPHRLSVKAISGISQYGNTLWSLRNFCITVFFKKYAKTTYVVKSFTVKLISRNDSQMIQKFRKLHTVRAQYGKTRNSLSLKEFRQINYLVIF